MRQMRCAYFMLKTLQKTYLTNFIRCQFATFGKVLYLRKIIKMIILKQ